jgi:putative MATE family efflux protein
MAVISRIGMDFTEGSIPKKMILFATPLLLANVLNSLYNTVDMIIIGQFAGSGGTVAVSIGGKLLMFITMVAMGLSTGGQILISQQVGAKQYDEIKNTVGTLFSILICIAVFFSVICLILSRSIIVALNTPLESFEQALAYLRITCLGLPLMFGYVAVSAVLRGMGDSRHPLLFIFIASVFNIIGDLVFIVCFNLGAAGTAIATVIGQGLSFLFAVIVLYKKRETSYFDFKLSSLKPDKVKLKIIMRIGLPMAAQSGLIQITQLVMMSFINMYGVIQAAAYGIGDKTIHLLNVAQMGMQQTGGAMAGQNIGAKKFERVSKIVKSILLLNLSLFAVITALVLPFHEIVFRFFTKDEAVMQYSYYFMLITSGCLLLSSFQAAFAGPCIGTGNAKMSFLAGLLDGVIVRVFFSLFLGWTLNMQVTGFFLANTLSRFGAIAVFAPYFFSGAFKRRKTLVETSKQGI